MAGMRVAAPSSRQVPRQRGAGQNPHVPSRGFRVFSCTPLGLRSLPALVSPVGGTTLLQHFRLSPQPIAQRIAVRGATLLPELIGTLYDALVDVFSCRHGW